MYRRRRKARRRRLVAGRRAPAAARGRRRVARRKCRCRAGWRGRRVAGFVRQTPTAAAHVKPALPGRQRQPVEECRPGGAAPAAHVALVTRCVLKVAHYLLLPKNSTPRHDHGTAFFHHLTIKIAQRKFFRAFTKINFLQRFDNLTHMPGIGARHIYVIRLTKNRMLADDGFAQTIPLDGIRG